MTATNERGVIRKEALGERSLERRAETSMAATAAHAEAIVKAQYAAAMMRPRNIEDARVRVLDACKRPAFAEKARYSKPVGKQKVTGLSIRFADEAAKLFGNIRTGQSTIFEDDDQRIVEVTATDLETNLTKSQTVVIKKIVERRKVYDGQEVIGQRENTTGEKVYIVRASDDEVFMKEANMCAKSRRNLELQLIPGDILEEAEQECIETAANADSADPNAARRKIIDAFAKYRIMPSDIERKLGHSVEMVSPSELQDLREIYSAISSGEASWQDFLSGDGDAEKKVDPLTPGRHETRPRKATTAPATPALVEPVPEAATHEPAESAAPDARESEEPEEAADRICPEACATYRELVKIGVRSPRMIERAIESAAKKYDECMTLKVFTDIDHTDETMCGYIMSEYRFIKDTAAGK